MHVRFAEPETGKPQRPPARCAARLKKGGGRTCRGTPIDGSRFCADHKQQQAELDAESYVHVPPACVT